MRKFKKLKGNLFYEQQKIIVRALIEKLKVNSCYYGNISYVEIRGTNFAAADIAMDGSGKTEVYRVIVVKHTN